VHSADRAVDFPDVRASTVAVFGSCLLAQTGRHTKYRDSEFLSRGTENANYISKQNRNRAQAELRLGLDFDLIRSE